MILRKIVLSTLSLVIVAVVSACSTSTMTPSVASVKATSDLSFVSNIKSGTVDPVKNSIFVADIGNGQKGANLEFTIKDGTPFKVKQGNGTRSAVFADIFSVNLTLRKNGTGVFTGDVPVGATVFTGAAGVGTRTFNFTNCGVGTYSVVVNDVKDSGSVSIFNSATPSTNDNVVNTFNQITSTGPMAVAITLKNGTPANIDATVTSTDGNNTFSAVTAS